MRSLAFIPGGALLLAASAVNAQPAPSSHAHHHARTMAAKTGGNHCCCERQVREMMSMMHQMMQMHGAMKTHEGTSLPADGGIKKPMQQMAPGQGPQSEPDQQ